MASKGLQSFSKNWNTLRAFTSGSRDPLTQCLAPRLSRSMATETALPEGISGLSEDFGAGIYQATANSGANSFAPPVTTTIYRFPTMEPLHFTTYPSNQLHLPLRRDILHRAVVYEGDGTRQGTAQTKTRHEIHGSHAKIRPQKGTGKARLGTKQSPMLRGGAKAHGPQARDFATGLPRKIYDLAWRTALSYRYRRGELIICEDGMEIEYPKTRYVKGIFEHNRWGKEAGRTLVVTGSFRKNLFRALRHAGEDGRCLMASEVDVKDLLETGRVVIERRALDEILAEHQSDLHSHVTRAV